MRIAFLGNFKVDYSSESHHAATLELLGHEVIRLQEPRASAGDIIDAIGNSQLFVWVHTHGWNTPNIGHALNFCRRQGIPSMTYHLDLWMGLQRQRDMRTDPYWEIDHFFTVDRLMAEWLNENTPVRGHYVNAAIFEKDCYIAEVDEPHPYANDIIFVGQKNYHREWPYRPQLIEWLESTYGDRFTRIAGDTPAGTTRGHDLNWLYASSKVVVGDSLCLGFDYPDYWSDRVYETVGRGGFLIHPAVGGMERHFKHGEHLMFYEYGDFDRLKALVDYYVADRYEQREKIRTAGQAHVRDNHTYTQRWTDILATVFA